MILSSLGDLYFLLHNFGEQIIPFKLGKLKNNYLKGKKDEAKSVHEAHYLLEDLNYNLERNYSRNILSRRRLNLGNFPTNYI